MMVLVIKLYDTFRKYHKAIQWICLNFILRSHWVCPANIFQIQQSALFQEKKNNQENERCHLTQNMQEISTFKLTVLQFIHNAQFKNTLCICFDLIIEKSARQSLTFSQCRNISKGLEFIRMCLTHSYLQHMNTSKSDLNETQNYA